MPTSDDDSRYRRWIEEECWVLYGGLNDAIAIALGKKPVLKSLPGDRPQYGFDVGQEEVQRFLDNVDAAKKLAERQKSNVDVSDEDKTVPVSRPDAAAEDDDWLFDPIDVEVPEDCAWDVPECSLYGMRSVRSREFVDWALRMGYPVPKVVVDGVRHHADPLRENVPGDEYLKEGQIESVPAPAPGRREQQVKTILAVAKELHFDPLAIPYGGKAQIKEACRTYSGLFTDSGFDEAWKAARKDEKVRVANHDKYTPQRGGKVGT